jgi:hypothetical protein
LAMMGRPVFFALDIKQKTRKTESCQGKNLFCFKYEVSTLVTRLLSLLEHLFPVFLGKVILSRDRRVCLGIFATALVPGKRDSGTRNYFCHQKKAKRDVSSRIVSGYPLETLV